MSNDIATALTTAEGLAGAALEAPADLCIVNPGDWPKVRRAMAQIWTLDPRPALAVSVAMPAGTALITGRDAFALFAGPVETVAIKSGGTFQGMEAPLVPSTFGRSAVAQRDVQLAVRKATGLRKVTGI